MLSTAIFVYAATSPVNGYFGGSLYAKQGGNRKMSWICSVDSTPLVKMYVNVSHCAVFRLV